VSVRWTCGLIACLAAGTAQAQLKPLHIVPVVAASEMTLPAGKPARVRVTTADAVALGRKLGVDVPQGAASFEYVLDRYPQIADAGERTWLEPTFVIDFDEPPVQSLKGELQASQPPAVAALVAFVANLIDENEPRSWDIASAVARRRQGDCSEHAVLMTALARMYGMPARLAIGVTIVSSGTDHGAYGHAWTEVRQGDRWVVADAALYDEAESEDMQVRYLPLGILEDEGMGYTLTLGAILSRGVQQVEIIGPAQ